MSFPHEQPIRQDAGLIECTLLSHASKAAERGESWRKHTEVSGGGAVSRVRRSWQWREGMTRCAYFGLAEDDMHNRISKPAGIAALAALLAISMVAAAQQKGGEDETGPYNLVTGWPMPVCGDGYQIGSVGGVFAETPDRVFVF